MARKCTPVPGHIGKAVAGPLTPPLSPPLRAHRGDLPKRKTERNVVRVDIRLRIFALIVGGASKDLGMMGFGGIAPPPPASLPHPGFLGRARIHAPPRPTHDRSAWWRSKPRRVGRAMYPKTLLGRSSLSARSKARRSRMRRTILSRSIQANEPRFGHRETPPDLSTTGAFAWHDLRQGPIGRRSRRWSSQRDRPTGSSFAGPPRVRSSPSWPRTVKVMTTVSRMASGRPSGSSCFNFAAVSLRTVWRHCVP